MGAKRFARIARNETEGHDMTETSNTRRTREMRSQEDETHK